MAYLEGRHYINPVSQIPKLTKSKVLCIRFIINDFIHFIDSSLTIPSN